ncbi:hypothetical protein Dimus_008470 [Dionaea muscipula]
MLDHGLRNVMEIIKRQKWESLFKRRELVHTDAVKEFYAKLTMSHNRKKDVAKSKVRGVEIEFDHTMLASILGIPGNNGICEYIKEVWKESKYTKPLEITRRFANDDTIMEARRVKSVEMKPFQRFIHFLVMKNVVPHFGKRDTTSFMDLIYMDHLIARRLVNLPRVMMRHMSYVISVKDHELPYGDWMTMVFEAFGVPLVDKKGEEPKIYDYFEETFLTMCKLTRKNGVWWIGSGENRRRDDVVDAPEEEAEEEEEGNLADFDWEAAVDEAADEGESGSGKKFYDAEDKDQGSPEVNEEIPRQTTRGSTQREEKESSESTLVSHSVNSMYRCPPYLQFSDLPMPILPMPSIWLYSLTLLQLKTGAPTTIGSEFIKVWLSSFDFANGFDLALLYTTPLQLKGHSR